MKKHLKILEMDYSTTSYGKVLITSEYFILKGALALAIPTNYSQSLNFTSIDSNNLIWEAYDEKKEIWFNTVFELPSLNIVKNDNEKSRVLQSILLSAQKLNSKFLNQSQGGKVKTNLDFPTNWGLGSSSTLINNISNWANINAYELLWLNFKGSGYDIACAKTKSSILYQLKNSKPIVKEVNFKPVFFENLFFIYLNKKQNSNKQIEFFNKKQSENSKLIDTFSDLTVEFFECKKLIDFQNCIKKHEILLSKHLNIKPVKENLFKDYSGEIKSLGAWGGDFILAAGPTNTPNYFNKKGFNTVISYKKMFI